MNYSRDEDSIIAFGKNLRRIRAKKKISQEQLALISGLEYSQISRIERGKINTSISAVFIIARSLKVQPKELFDF